MNKSITLDQAQDYYEGFPMKVSETNKITETKPSPSHLKFQEELNDVLNSVNWMLCEKNLKYGDSALKPSQIFASCDPIELINVRIDDKLARIKNAKGNDHEDAELDLLGHLVLKRIAMNRK